MPSRPARAVSRCVAAAFAAFACAAGVGLATAGSAAADPAPPADVALAVESRSVGLVTSLGGTVGVAAVAAGVGGMVAGVVRRRRGAAVVDPANERKE
ncbi:hypothetical protein [Streptoalloteichus hindustanus]|uniref:Uncharacterized protein n=1 Tax=Streptoalloteichus hindustanus TaxID=2017 RepID=A0A1M5KD15_STRHI|nr:hypothetical protein [Streptoalloteichus hindustanus]SHG50530.1 hypothetical protein SAMN05444320_109224 [Streptoalloteichus hindustanus]